MITMPAYSTSTPAVRAKKRQRWCAGLIVAGLIAVAITGGLAFNAQPKAPSAHFNLLSGQSLTTQDLKGKVYVINFWDTDCEACVHEMPQMSSTYNAFKDQGFELVAVAIKTDRPEYVKNFAQSRGLPFKVALDDGSAATAFGNVSLTPTTVLVDRQGHILKRYVGEPSFAEFRDRIRKALDQAPPRA